jgi:hypothetical protein
LHILRHGIIPILNNLDDLVRSKTPIMLRILSPLLNRVVKAVSLEGYRR